MVRAPKKSHGLPDAVWIAVSVAGLLVLVWFVIVLARAPLASQNTRGAVTGGSLDEYAPGVDPIDGTEYWIVTIDRVLEVDATGRYVWKYAYYQNASDDWVQFPLFTTGLSGTQWQNGTIDVPLPIDAPEEGYVIGFVCEPVGTEFICGPRDEDAAVGDRYWTIAAYTKETT